MTSSLPTSPVLPTPPTLPTLTPLEQFDSLKKSLLSLRSEKVDDKLTNGLLDIIISLGSTTSPKAAVNLPDVSTVLPGVTKLPSSLPGALGSLPVESLSNVTNVLGSLPLNRSALTSSVSSLPTLPDFSKDNVSELFDILTDLKAWKHPETLTKLTSLLNSLK